MSEPVNVGIIGCGNISGAYLQSERVFGKYMRIAACADICMDRARARAAEAAEKGWCKPKAVRVPALLADPSIEIVINLTQPQAHYKVAMRSLKAGKHVHNEKPLALTMREGRKLLDAARAFNLRVGCAPDTVLGAGTQTCRKLLNDGAIGEPVAGCAFMMCRGHESWHPAPEFYYKAGGGPMFDMGPYYLTCLVTLLGPVRRVSGAARISFPERVITSEPKKGARIAVDVPTHVAGTLEFASGPIVTIVTSFDVCFHHMPNIEIYGSAGSLTVPDPNGFGGAVSIRRAGDETPDWSDVPLTHGNAGGIRGFGPADMARAIRTGRPHRASGELGMHVLEIMHGLHKAARTGRYQDIQNTVEIPAPLPPGLPDGELD